MLTYNFNAVALTDKGIPLPICLDESIVLCLYDVNCSFFIARTVESYKFQIGTLFLTTKRIIFISTNQNSFVSFLIPLKRVLSCSKGEISFMSEDNTLGIFKIEGSTSKSNIFESLVNQQLSKTVVEVIEDMSDKGLPLYCDLND